VGEKILELSVKQDKHSTKTLSLVIHRVRFSRNLQNSTLAFKVGVKTINFGGKLSFIPSFLFPERLHCCYIYFPCSTSTTTILSLETCASNAEFEHFVLRCSISYWDLIKCPYFADTTERGDGGLKGGPNTGWRQGYFKDNSIIKKSFKEVSDFYNFDIWNSQVLSIFWNSQVLCPKYVGLYKEIWS